jgi:hypothetical protein
MTATRNAPGENATDVEVEVEYEPYGSLPDAKVGGAADTPATSNTYTSASIPLALKVTVTVSGPLEYAGE